MKMDVIGSISHSICITGATFGARVSLQGCDSTTSLRTHDKIGVLLTFAFLVFFPFRHLGPTEHSSANWQEQSVPSNSGKPSSEETPLAPPHWAPDKLAGCSVFTRRIRIDADRHLISQRDVKRSFVRAGLRLQSDANRPHPATLLLFTHFYPSSATPLTDHYQ